MHALLVSNGVKHVYHDSLRAAHRWNESWMVPTLDALVALTDAQGLE
jgi:hypothetical protein